MGEKDNAEQDDTAVARGSDDAVNETKPAASAADAIPNGGLTAWLQVVGAFFLMFNSW